MPIANKRQIVSSNGQAAVKVESGVVRTVAGAAQSPTLRARKMIIVDPITGSAASVTGGALVTT